MDITDSQTKPLELSKMMFMGFPKKLPHQIGLKKSETIQLFKSVFLRIKP